ncbi:uncharacterized protein LOC128549110 [Mercenaria mercenaria]|uniref:uncharacterized protein LOC128549110 n=1 Tax=Mercenaria mercenaria TaxID=6596 RepID=UPI00234F0D7C|nr:uncharacterized protein LOC128549110 [Mercenaria mercenaria]
MEVGLSLEEISTEDELGISLCESQSSMSDDEQYSPQYHFGNTLSVILPEREPVDEVPCSNELTIESNIDFGPSRDREKHSSTEDELGISLESSSSDELGISLDDMSDYPDDCFNAQTSFQAADVMDYETVRAKIRPPNHVNHFLPSEVSSGKRMKSKALSLLSIKSALSEKCLCGKQCIKKVTFKSVRELRQSFWTNSRTVRMQLLKYYISHSTTSGKFKYIPISSNLQVCSKAFLIIYRVNKNTFSRAIDMDRRDVASLPGKKPRDSSEKTLILINWLEDYGTYHGDRMPDSGDVLLPYRTKKTSLFEKYKLESAQWSYQAVSRTQFYKTWDTYFPHMKIKKVKMNCKYCNLK